MHFSLHPPRNFVAGTFVAPKNKQQGGGKTTKQFNKEKVNDTNKQNKGSFASGLLDQKKFWGFNFTAETAKAFLAMWTIWIFCKTPTNVALTCFG